MANDYTVQKLVDRVTLKALTSTSTNLTPQQIVDLANDSLRSYLVPVTQTLREEWWVGRTDISVTTDSDGRVLLPDSVASTLRTVAWNNAGVITPLTRIEPENSFQYLSQQGQLPLGFELRGYTLVVLPKTPGIEMKLTAMLRPSQMVLDDAAAQLLPSSGATLNLVSVPVAWQETAPTSVDLVSADSPFIVIGTYTVASLDVTTKVLTLTETPTIPAGLTVTQQPWVSDAGTSPFASVPVELYPLLEQDVVCTLFQATGDKRLNGALQRKTELENWAKRTMGPRTAGNARPIVNPSAPGMRSLYGWWGRGR